MTKKPNIQILISCHKPCAYIENEILRPIQLNCDAVKELFPGMLRDNTGDNISKLNNMYCELTAQYWAWKNLDADYYGFCHYRRYFNFSGQKYKEDEYGNIIETYPGDFTIDKYGLSADNIRRVIADNDIIITETKDVAKMPGGANSIIEQYQKAPLLHAKDIESILNIIKLESPEYYLSAERFLYGRKTNFCNMYILKKEIFFEYCEWMFKILGSFCKQTDMTNYSTEALRTPGHLSERLFGIFLTKKSQESQLKIKELQCIWFKNTEPQEIIEPIKKENAIPIVLAANNTFVPVFATCLQSIINTSTANHFYDIVLIHSDITEENKNILLGMVSKQHNFSLRFFNASTLLADYNLVANEHISSETYYRFLIQDMMPKYQKILYIDCDLVVKKDLSELYNTDLGDSVLAATHDADFAGQVNGANKWAAKYADEVLNLEDPFTYAQAGVILFNEEKMRELHSVQEWLQIAQKRYKYSDQDIINKFCTNKIKTLDMRWNVLMDCNHERIKNTISYAPQYIQKEYFEARNNPYIIHYAGFMKPWYDPSQDFAKDFWLTARKTPFYEDLLIQATHYISSQNITQLARQVSFRGKTKNRLTRIYRHVVKPKSTTDKRIKKMIKKIKDSRSV